jgi:hypothetical protein
MTRVPESISTLERDLRDIFGARLQSLVAFGLRSATPPHPPDRQHGIHVETPRTRTLAVVESLTGDDLKKCAERVARWDDAGLATPLLLAAHEFGRSLDAFPFEFGSILADHTIVAGRDPFDGLSVDPTDLRRACEVQARSHLLHLREGFVETKGRADALAVLIVRSAAPFAALLTWLARLEGLETTASETSARHLEHVLHLAPGMATEVVALVNVTEITSAEALRIFPAYLDAAERLVGYVDTWRVR